MSTRHSIHLTFASYCTHTLTHTHKSNWKKKKQKKREVHRLVGCRNSRITAGDEREPSAQRDLLSYAAVPAASHSLLFFILCVDIEHWIWIEKKPPDSSKKLAAADLTDCPCITASSCCCCTKPPTNVFFLCVCAALAPRQKRDGVCVGVLCYMFLCTSSA